jgi:hypothetical protein
MDDLRTDPEQELVHGVHVGPLAGAEADVVEADAELREALVAPAVLRLDDADRRPPAHAVEHAVRLEDGSQAEEAEHLLVEGQAGAEVADGIRMTWKGIRMCFRGNAGPMAWYWGWGGRFMSAAR